MPTRLELEVRHVQSRIEQGDPFWPPQLAVAIAIGLNFALSNKLALGPIWLIPSVEGVLLLALVILGPARATAHSAGRRRCALAVVGLVSVVNIAALALLVHYLLQGGHASGRELVLSGVLLLATNVLLFGVWYWELDRGGPVERFLDPAALADFQFPQMENPQLAPPGWRPGFLDYLYTSLTNATAFSPTDTLPLSHTAKALMALQSTTALATVGLVVARAVNILQ